MIGRRQLLMGLFLGLAACATPTPAKKPSKTSKKPRRKPRRKARDREDKKPPRDKSTEVASREPARGPSARNVLSSYLEATFAGRHATAWGLLTSEERRRVTKEQYLAREGANDRLRAQVRALGPTRFEIDGINESSGSGSDEAVATVTIRSGLGAEATRFVLRREEGRWGVDYQRSWGTAR